MGESISARSHYMNVFEKINHCFLYFEKIVLTFCTIVLVIAIFIQVVCRYILLISTPWAEELARYLFVWMAYLGGGYALHTGGQIEIDIAPTIIKSLKGISTATKRQDHSAVKNSRSGDNSSVSPWILLGIWELYYVHSWRKPDIPDNAYPYVDCIFPRTYWIPYYGVAWSIQDIVQYLAGIC